MKLVIENSGMLLQDPHHSYNHLHKDQLRVEMIAGDDEDHYGVDVELVVGSNEAAAAVFAAEKPAALAAFWVITAVLPELRSRCCLTNPMQRCEHWSSHSLLVGVVVVVQEQKGTFSMPDY